MAEEPSFSELVCKVRAGDEEAAAELMRRYEPALRKAIRNRLTDPAMRRIMDSMDVCQSVMSNFFVRTAAGQFDLKNPKQLVALLATMARNKVTNLALKERAARRGGGGARVGLSDVQPAARDPSPSQIVASNELLREFLDRLTDEERYLAKQRALERSWAEIAAEVGGDPNALRIRLRRAIVRVARNWDWNESITRSPSPHRANLRLHDCARLKRIRTGRASDRRSGRHAGSKTGSLIRNFAHCAARGRRLHSASAAIIRRSVGRAAAIASRRGRVSRAVWGRVHDRRGQQSD